MNKVESLLGLLLVLMIPSPGLTQEPPAPSDLFLTGLTISTGVGHYSMRDQLLLGERFTGTGSFSEISWARFEDGRGSRMTLGLRASGDVRNHTLSAAASGVTLDLEACNRIGTLPVLGRRATVCLGPSAGAAVFTDDKDPLHTGSEPAISSSVFISAGAISGVVLPLNPRLTARATGRFDLFSVGLRTLGPTTADLPPKSLHRAANATYGSAGISLRYELDEPLSVGLGYVAQFMRIGSWEYLGLARSRLVAAVTLRPRQGEGREEAHDAP
jgi:hypothetical protein